MSIVTTICARGGSKGLPGKNIKLLHGKPLIAHSIEIALACDFIDGVYVSTDDEEIASIAENVGAVVPFIRPPELATDAAAKIPVIIHLIEAIEQRGVKVDKIVDLDPTSPLRTSDDILNCINLLDENVDIVITGYEAEKNPYFNMVELNQHGFANISKVASNEFYSRQSSPKVYAMNGSVYVWHRHTLDKGLWGGRTQFYEMPRERSIDIDSAIDFELVNLLMSKAKGII